MNAPLLRSGRLLNGWCWPASRWRERAGKMLGKDKRPLLVVAGPGNNGGDAFIAAVELHAGGRKVRTVFYGDEKKLSADAKRALAQYRQSVGEPGKDIKDDEYALVIDGLFGIGLSRLPGPKMNKAVRLINCLACPVLAIDTPSGLCADSGRTWGDVVPATRTLSFFGAKPGFIPAWVWKPSAKF